MKKFIPTLGLSLALSWLLMPLFSPAGDRTGAEVPADDEAELAAPVFSLETAAEDAQALAVMKAAMRLVKGYTVTVNQLRDCAAAGTPRAEKARDGFISRNGSTFSRALTVIKRLGGLTKEMKAVLDQAIADESQAAYDCRELTAEALGGGRDIYKAPPFIDDYKLVRSFK
ncbi:MAG: hypothetical protein LBS31_10340 [Candidatus Adiutrix sp.]|jgi:hypothetical protein|nr:hypothetical protein [Candidatus Adiutrix sp.]